MPETPTERSVVPVGGPGAEPEGLRPPESRPRDDDRPTRKPMALWDRIKFLLLLTGLFLVLVWASMADNPLLPFADAARLESQESRWIFVLLGIEVVRQLHFLISERWAAYHRFWTTKVFGGLERWSHRRFSDWTRYRLRRVVTILIWVAILALVLAQIYDTSPVLALFQAPAAFLQALPWAFRLLFGFFFIMVQFIGLFWFLSRGGIDTYFPDDIKTRFSDVWGQDHVVRRVKENIVFLENPDEIEAKGGYVPGGILLWGPPGTGKTLMAEAVAGETGKPYVFVDPGAFINMFFGIGILKVKGLFRKLRKLALRYGGVIVFFDEADALGNRGTMTAGGPGGGPRGMQGMAAHPAAFAHGGCHGFSYLSPDTQSLLVRESMARSAVDEAGPVDADDNSRRSRFVMGGMGGGGGGMGTLQALLTELSGLKKPRGLVNRYVRRWLGMRPKAPPKYRILVMMASNMPEALDEALLRPGRIDRIYKVGYPSKAGRVRTYEGYFSKVRHELTPEEMDKLAVITPYATGATMKDLVNEALITAIRDGRDVITWRDVMKAKQLKELGPPEDVEYIERERHAVAVHEACHAVVAYRTRRHMEIDIATIEKGSDYLGMVASIPPEDQFTRWRTEYESDILVSLASLAGERMFFGGDNSSGVSGDLESATSVASLMEGYWGMGSTVSSFATARRLEVGAPGGRGKPKQADDPEAVMRQALADRIEDKLADLLLRAEAILRDQRRQVFALAHALETHKTLTGDDVVAVIEGQVGPLVDGRDYVTEEFGELAEEYHAAAVAAHQKHAPMNLPMPRVRAPVPVFRSPFAPPPTDDGQPSNGRGASPNGSQRGSGTESDGRAQPPGDEGGGETARGGQSNGSEGGQPPTS